MNLIEIAQEARPDELFQHDDDDSQYYFDECHVLRKRVKDGIYALVLTQEKITSDKWHLIAGKGQTMTEKLKPFSSVL